MSLPVSSLRSLHLSPYSLQLLSSHQEIARYQAILVMIFHNDPETSLVPALQSATVSSSSYCICPPNFLFLSPGHYPSIPPLPASHTLSPLHSRQIQNKFLPFAMLHQKCHSYLYEHSSSIPVQNKTNQFSGKIKLTFPNCLVSESSSTRTSQGPLFPSCSSCVLK